MLPSITAAGTVGSVPIRPAQYYVQNWWGGIGVNMNIPDLQWLPLLRTGKGGIDPCTGRL